ncbi:Tim17-domain-containing protein [Atractiella rhizophila]|nr:Tim17-domain-containing protein [Atractiella rhizophila]
MSSSSSSGSASNELLSGVSYASPSSDPFTPDSPSASSILSSPSGLSAIHPLSGLGNSQELDYLLLEDEKLQSLDGGRGVLPTRGWGDELCYGTGTTYLTGLAFGGLWGLREGLRVPLSARVTAFAPLKDLAATAPPTSAFAHAHPYPHPVGAAAGAATLDAGAIGAQAQTQTRAQTIRRAVPFRLRLNTVLNAMTRRGSFMGNTSGILALFYNGFNATIDRVRGKHDVWGSMGAGWATGVVWRSTAGLRPMLIASTTLTVAAGAWTKCKHYLF